MQPPFRFPSPFCNVSPEPGAALSLEARCRVDWDSVPVPFSRQVLHTWLSSLHHRWRRPSQGSRFYSTRVSRGEGGKLGAHRGRGGSEPTRLTRASRAGVSDLGADPAGRRQPGRARGA